jgi:hypothetical protein
VGGEKVALGAGELVLGEGCDLLEEFGAGLVIEEPRREGLGSSRQTKMRRGSDCVGDGTKFGSFDERGG